VSIQPSEIIKVSIILALAKFYHDLRFDRIGYIPNLFFPMIIIIIPFILIVIQPDLGTSLSIFVLGVSIMFIAGVKIWKFVVGLLIMVISYPFFWNSIKPYQQKRIISFLNPESDPLGQGYQLIQSKIALGSGSLTGKGFLEGTQSYLEYLPEKQTDFIFTLIGEEFGFIGSIFVIFLYSLLILIAFYISIKSIHVFGRILSLGVALNLFIYVILNMAAVTGLMPVVGIPLPLLSYGGTAMLSVMVSFGLLLNVDLHYNCKKMDQ
jgi:rod shape determining protein RodA